MLKQIISISDDGTISTQVVKMTPEEIAALPQLPPASLPDITRRQLRLWLLGAGKDDNDVRTAIATIPDQMAQKAAVIEWEDSTLFKRDHPLIAYIAPMLGLNTPEAIDAAWFEATRL